MEQQWKEGFEKPKQTKLLTTRLSSTRSAEQEAPPPLVLVLGEAERPWVEQTPAVRFDALLRRSQQCHHLTSSTSVHGPDPSRTVWCAAATISAAPQPRWEVQSAVLLLTVRGSPGLTANVPHAATVRPGCTSYPSFKKNCSSLCPGNSKHRNLRRHRVCA